MSIGKEMIVIKAKLSERKCRRRDNERRADTLTRVIREIIDPLGGDFTGWNILQFEVLSRDLVSLWKETKGIDEEIAAMEREIRG